MKQQSILIIVTRLLQSIFYTCIIIIKKLITGTFFFCTKLTKYVNHLKIKSTKNNLQSSELAGIVKCKDKWKQCIDKQTKYQTFFTLNLNLNQMKLLARISSTSIFIYIYTFYTIIHLNSFVFVASLRASTFCCAPSRQHFSSAQLFLCSLIEQKPAKSHTISYKKLLFSMENYNLIKITQN